VRERDLAGGRADRIISAVDHLRDHVDPFQALQLDLLALAATASSTEDTELIATASERLEASAAAVGAALDELERRVQAADEIRRLQAADEIRRLREIVANSTVFAKSLWLFASLRPNEACALLENSDAPELEEYRLVRLDLLFLAQREAGHYDALYETAQTQADGNPATDREDMTAEVVASMFGGRLWLRRLDDAEALTSAAEGNGVISSEVAVGYQVNAAAERLADMEDSAQAVAALRTLVERALGLLDDADRDDSAFAGPLAESHIQRRRRRRQLHRARYYALVEEFAKAVSACQAAEDLQQSLEFDLDERRTIDAVNALIALRRGAVVEVEALLDHSALLSSIDPTRRLVTALVATDAGSLDQARTVLTELLQVRPGEVPALVALTNVVLLASSTKEDEGSKQSDALDLLAAEKLLVRLRDCAEKNGRGYSTVPSKRTIRYINLASAHVALRNAARVWYDRDAARGQLDTARGYLDKIDSQSPSVEAMRDGHAELDRVWRAKRLGRARMVAVGLVAAVVLAIWTNKYNQLDGSALIGGTLLVIGLTLFLLFRPWINKLSIGGFELQPEHIADTTPPQPPALDRELLMATLRDQIQTALLTGVATSTLRIVAPSLEAEKPPPRNPLGPEKPDFRKGASETGSATQRD
jgi:hypothetical protein